MAARIRLQNGALDSSKKSASSLSKACDTVNTAIDSVRKSLDTNFEYKGKAETVRRLEAVKKRIATQKSKMDAILKMYTTVETKLTAADKAGVKYANGTNIAAIKKSTVSFGAADVITAAATAAVADAVAANDPIALTVSGAMTGEQAANMYANKEKVDISGYSTKYSVPNATFNQSGGCTWYAASRYRAVNGVDHDLQFSSRGGNAENWINSINKDAFDVSSTSDISVIKTNTLAISNAKDSISSMGKDPGGFWQQAGENHVCYVEYVDDEYVYYTQGAHSTAPEKWGYVLRATKEDFARDYEYIISAKEE